MVWRRRHAICTWHITSHTKRLHTPTLPLADLPVSRSRSAADRSLTSWQTVLPLLDGRPLPVAPGQVVRARATVALPGAVDEPVQYSVDFFSDRG